MTTVTGSPMSARGATLSVGVQTTRFPSMRCAISGEPAAFGASTIADGIAVKAPGKLTLPIIKERVSDILLVDEGDIEQAIVMLLEIEKTLTEGAGAASLAAILRHRERFHGKRVGLVLSGGNIDPLMLSAIIERGMIRTGRLTRLIVEMRDPPSALAELTGCLAELNANIEKISHQRAFTNLPVQTVEVELVVQTRSHDHVREVMDALARKGFGAKLELACSRCLPSSTAASVSDAAPAPPGTLGTSEARPCARHVDCSSTLGCAKRTVHAKFHRAKQNGDARIPAVLVGIPSRSVHTLAARGWHDDQGTLDVGQGLGDCLGGRRR